MRSSIRRKLGLLTGVSTAALVGVVFAFVWWRMSHVLRADLDQTLQTEALALSGRLEDEEGKIHLELESGSLAEAGLRGDVLAEICALDGRVIFRSTELDRAKSFARPPIDAAGGASPIWFDVDPVAGQPYRAVALHYAIRRDAEDERPRAAMDALAAWVFVARPLAPLQQTLRELAWTLGGASLLALAVTLLVSYRVARSGVAPIHAVAREIAGAQPGQPALRIRPEDVPNELDPIVTKTNDLLRRIEAELTRQRRLTADVAHDLRTPVAGVRTLLDVCLQKKRTPGEYEETLTTAQAALRQLSALLDDVLTMARLDASAERPLPAPVHVAEAIRRALDAVGPLAAARRTRIEVDCDPDLVIFSDGAKLTKIAANLIGNAIEYGPFDSRVVVSAALVDRTLQIHVADQGPGIPRELREKIFDRFFRSDDARTNAGHHGLGLPIARGLARLLGGDVRVASSSQSGSVCELWLPQRPSATVQTDAG